MTAPTLEEITEAVADTFEVPVAELRGPSRGRYHVRPRQIAFWLARRSARCNLGSIGRYFGNRDHTTVLHGIRRTEEIHIKTFGPEIERLQEQFNPVFRHSWREWVFKTSRKGQG